MMPECYCETCGKGYQVADSDAHSQADFCSRVCEEALTQLAPDNRYYRA